MQSFLIHAAFDVLAGPAAAPVFVVRIGRVAFPVPEPLRRGDLAALMLGAAAGACLFGSANLWLPGESGIARSIEGAVAGGIAAIEICKRGVKRSCIRFVTPAGQIIPFDTYNLFYRNGRIDAIRARMKADVPA